MEPATFTDAFSRHPSTFASMFLLGFLGLLCVAGAFTLLYAYKKSTTAAMVGGVAVLVGLLALSTGAISYTFFLSNASFVSQSPGLTTADQDRLASLAEAEARYSLITGISTGMLPLLGGAAALTIGLLRRRKRVGTD